MTEPDSRSSPSLSRHLFAVSLGGILLVQAAALSTAASANQLRMNPDGVVYLRLSRYLIEGNWDLFVSGCWGPLITVVIAPFLAGGMTPLLAARAALVVSSLLFTIGSVLLFLSCRLSREAVLAGAAVIAFCSVPWSVVQITPDLLMSGVLAAAAAASISGRWGRGWLWPVACGALWGLTYLTKAVAFPIAILSVAGFAILHWRSAVPLKTMLRSMALTAAGFLLVGLPWMTVLSVKYGYPTFATNTKLIAGPGANPVTPIVRTLHVPDPGRITMLEDPTGFPPEPWSPLDSVSSAKYQLEIVWRNVAVQARLLYGLAWAAFGLVVFLVTAIQVKKLLGGGDRSRWRWAVVPVLASVAIYLQVFSDDERYFYPLVPFLFAMGWGQLTSLASRLGFSEAMRPWIALVLALLFIGPQAPRFVDSLNGHANEGSLIAHRLAKELRRTGLVGPIAGGTHGADHAGIYLSFLLDQPWYGTIPLPDGDKFVRSGARLIIVPRKAADLERVAGSPDLIDLDEALFGNARRAASYPVKVFENRSAVPGVANQPRERGQ